MATDKDKQGLPKPSDPNFDEDLFYAYTNDVASATECTGLMPTPPITTGEAESYSDIYPVPEVEDKVNNGLQREKGIGGDTTKK